MNREQLDETVKAIMASQEFNDTTSTLETVLREHDPAPTIVALLFVAAMLARNFGFPFTDIYRFAGHEFEPADATRNQRSATQAAAESLHAQKDNPMPPTLEDQVLALTKSVTDLTTLINHVTGPTGPLLTAAQQLVTQIDAINHPVNIEGIASELVPATDTAPDFGPVLTAMSSIAARQDATLSLLTEIAAQFKPSAEVSPTAPPEETPAKSDEQAAADAAA